MFPGRAFACDWILHRGLLFCVMVITAVPVFGDVLVLSDGRQFEGVIRSESADAIQLDTLVSGIRATLSLKRSDIKSLEKKPLPENFFDSAEAGGDATPPARTPYIEVPIIGRFKEQVYTQGLRSALVQARKNAVRHVVFTVDSTGGAVDEAGGLYRTLIEFEKDLTYHVVIRKCTGEAIIFPFLAKTVHLLPGAQVGGSDQKMEHLPAKYVAKKEEAVVREQIGEDLQEAARKRGRRGELIRAMIDPAESLAAWRDETGEVKTGSEPPAGIPPDRLIFKDGPGSVLTLSFEQATALGIPSLKNGPQELGDLLGLPGWQEAGNYGRDAMNKAAAIRQGRAASQQQRSEDAMARNVRLRETTQRAIDHNLQEAAAWNPTKASYKSFARYWSWTWDPGASWDLHVWTPESQRRWRDRTEACTYYLSRAEDSIRSMIRLDKQAVSLGLSPTFQEDALQSMLDDVLVKLEMLNRNRNRVGD